MGGGVKSDDDNNSRADSRRTETEAEPSRAEVADATRHEATRMLLIWSLIRVCRFVHSGRSSAELIVISQESRGREVVSSGQTGSKDNFEIAVTTFILLRRRNVTAMAKRV